MHDQQIITSHEPAHNSLACMPSKPGRDPSPESVAAVGLSGHFKMCELRPDPPDSGRSIPSAPARNAEIQKQPRKKTKNTTCFSDQASTELEHGFTVLVLGSIIGAFWCAHLDSCGCFSSFNASHSRAKLDVQVIKAAVTWHFKSQYLGRLVTLLRASSTCGYHAVIFTLQVQPT